MKVKPIDWPRAARLKARHKAKETISRKTLGKSIEERPEEINVRREFGDWEIDLVFGAKIKDEPVILTLVERQTRYALGYKLDNKLSETVNQTVEQLVLIFPFVPSQLIATLNLVV